MPYSKPVIMIVDDNPAICALLKRLLVNNKWEITVFDSPEEALQYGKNNRIDLMITDISMPKMTGQELIRQIKSVKPDIPVIVMSSAIDAQVMEETAKHGVVDYFRKPFDIAALKSRVMAKLSLASAE
jgi:CheY-like chemotaxis protein